MNISKENYKRALAAEYERGYSDGHVSGQTAVQNDFDQKLEELKDRISSDLSHMLDLLIFINEQRRMA